MQRKDKNQLQDRIVQLGGRVSYFRNIIFSCCAVCLPNE